jgi:hypothetical protein
MLRLTKTWCILIYLIDDVLFVECLMPSEAMFVVSVSRNKLSNLSLLIRKIITTHKRYWEHLRLYCEANANSIYKAYEYESLVGVNFLTEYVAC